MLHGSLVTQLRLWLIIRLIRGACQAPQLATQVHRCSLAASHVYGAAQRSAQPEATHAPGHPQPLLLPPSQAEAGKGSDPRAPVRRLYLQGLRAILLEMRGARGADSAYGHTLRLQPNVTDGARLNKVRGGRACSGGRGSMPARMWRCLPQKPVSPVPTSGSSLAATTSVLV